MFEDWNNGSAHIVFFVLVFIFPVGQANFSLFIRSADESSLQTLLWTMGLHLHLPALSPGSQKHAIATQQPFRQAFTYFCNFAVIL